MTEARAVQRRLQLRRHAAAGTLACAHASVHGCRPRCSTSHPGTCRQEAGRTARATQ